jgi:hypothetical protein
MNDPFSLISTLSTGDMVRHPVSGLIGVIIGKEPTGMWMVEWIFIKTWDPLDVSIRTSEYDSAIVLVRKAAQA